MRRELDRLEAIIVRHSEQINSLVRDFTTLASRCLALTIRDSGNARANADELSSSCSDAKLGLQVEQVFPKNLAAEWRPDLNAPCSDHLPVLMGSQRFMSAATKAAMAMAHRNDSEVDSCTITQPLMIDQFPVFSGALEALERRLIGIFSEEAIRNSREIQVLRELTVGQGSILEAQRAEIQHLANSAQEKISRDVLDDSLQVLETKLMREFTVLAVQQQNGQSSMEQIVAEHRLVLNAHTDSIENLSAHLSKARDPELCDSVIPARIAIMEKRLLEKIALDNRAAQGALAKECRGLIADERDIRKAQEEIASKRLQVLEADAEQSKGLVSDSFRGCLQRREIFAEALRGKADAPIWPALVQEEIAEQLQEKRRLQRQTQRQQGVRFCEDVK